MQPELWTISQQKISLDVKERDYDLKYDCYYNEKPPVISVGDDTIAQIRNNGNSVTIKPVKSGSTFLAFRFAETENNIRDEYRITIDITSSATEEPVPTATPTVPPVQNQVVPVKFSVKGIVGGRSVTFSTDTQDAVIYYSSKSSTLTSEDICVKNGETVLFEDFYGTLYARAYKDGKWGNVSRLILKIPVVNTPRIACRDGVVEIKTTTPGSTIYYTTDGSTPSPSNGSRMPKSAGSFRVPFNCTVKAIAVRSCFTTSEVVTYYK